MPNPMDGSGRKGNRQNSGPINPCCRRSGKTETDSRARYMTDRQLSTLKAVYDDDDDDEVMLC